MRGQVDRQGGMFSYFSVEERVPADHPLRRVKAQADAVLASMVDLDLTRLRGRVGT